MVGSRGPGHRGRSRRRCRVVEQAGVVGREDGVVRVDDVPGVGGVVRGLRVAQVGGLVLAVGRGVLSAQLENINLLS